MIISIGTAYMDAEYDTMDGLSNEVLSTTTTSKECMG
jgi:hypothetical protein